MAQLRRRINDRGQLTIPHEIRKLLDLGPGAEVVLEPTGDSLVLRKPFVAEPGRGKKLVEMMSGRATIGMSTDEIMALTRGED